MLRKILFLKRIYDFKKMKYLLLLTYINIKKFILQKLNIKYK